MSILDSKVAICGALFVFALISGLVLSSLGKPLNSLIFTIHKLVAIGTVILLAVSLYQSGQTVDIRMLSVAAFIVTGLSFLSLIVSGALLSLVAGDLLSLEPAMLQIVLRVHQIAPLLALVTSALSIYTVVGSRV